MTVHNRREKTLACLESLRRQQDVAATVEVYLVDDGSTDGTAEAVRKQFPNVHVHVGDGTLYWNRGMHAALAAAYRHGYDGYLWLNDDTMLDTDALSRLLITWRDVSDRCGRPSIVVGSTRDPDSGRVTYGGRYRPSRIRRTRFCVLPPAATMPRRTETMNGNLVLVPADVVARVGNLEPAYRHGGGDEDYGLRARQSGCEIWLAPGFLATCPRDGATSGGHRTLRDELRDLADVKRFEPRSWALFTRRWAGPLWPLYFVSPYMRGALRVIRAQIASKRERTMAT